jgi:hypothetical protein
MAEREHGGDAGLAVAGEDQLAGCAVTVVEFFLRQFLFLPFDDVVALLLFVFFSSSLVGYGPSEPMAYTLTGLMLTAVTSKAAASKMPMRRSAWVEVMAEPLLCSSGFRIRRIGPMQKKQSVIGG